MKNQDTWRYAHELCGRVWLWIGLILLFLSLISMIVLFCILSKDTKTVGTYGGIICGVQLMVLVVSVFLTEVALKKKFDRDVS